MICTRLVVMEYSIKYLERFMSVLRQRISSLVIYMIIVICCLAANSIAVYECFGATVVEFSSIMKAFKATFSTGLEELDYHSLVKDYPLFGLVIYGHMCYLFMVVIFPFMIAVLLDDVENQDANKSELIEIASSNACWRFFLKIETLNRCEKLFCMILTI